MSLGLHYCTYVSEVIDVTPAFGGITQQDDSSYRAMSIHVRTCRSASAPGKNTVMGAVDVAAAPPPCLPADIEVDLPSAFVVTGFSLYKPTSRNEGGINVVRNMTQRNKFLLFRCSGHSPVAAGNLAPLHKYHGLIIVVV